MAAKVLFVLCASTVLVQSIYGQCIGNAFGAEEFAYGYGPGLTNGLAYGAGSYGPYGFNAVAPTSGGGFPITSSSPISPTGISVVSENAIEGAVSIIGELPFLSAIALEGALPTAGAGGINYGCGSGAIGIVSEGIAPAYWPAMGPAASVAPGRFGYGAGFGAPGCAAPGLAAAGLGGFGYGAMY